MFQIWRQKKFGTIKEKRGGFYQYNYVNLKRKMLYRRDFELKVGGVKIVLWQEGVATFLLCNTFV